MGRYFLALLVILAISLIWLCSAQGKAFSWTFLYDSETIFNRSVNGRDRTASLAESMARDHVRRGRPALRELQVLGRIHAGRIRDDGVVNQEDLEEDFRGFDANQEADPELEELLGRLELLEGEVQGILPAAFTTPITNLSEQAHKSRREKIVESMRGHSGSKKTKAVLSAMETHTSIPENVHDRAVMEAMNEKVKFLKSLEIPEQDTFPEIANYISEAKFPTRERELALKTLEKILDSQVFIMGLEAREDEVLRMVWNRSHDPSNEEQSENIREAVVVALRDAWHWEELTRSYEIVCPNGRAERLVEALVLLDSEDVLSQSVNTSENLKNDIYREAQLWHTQALKGARDRPGGELLWKSHTQGLDYEDLCEDKKKIAQAEQLGEECQEQVLEQVDASLARLGNKLPHGLGPRIREDVRIAIST